MTNCTEFQFSFSYIHLLLTPWSTFHIFLQACNSIVIFHSHHRHPGRNPLAKTRGPRQRQQEEANNVHHGWWFVVSCVLQKMEPARERQLWLKQIAEKRNVQLVSNFLVVHKHRKTNGQLGSALTFMMCTKCICIAVVRHVNKMPQAG